MVVNKNFFIPKVRLSDAPQLIPIRKMMDNCIIWLNTSCDRMEVVHRIFMEEFKWVCLKNCLVVKRNL